MENGIQISQETADYVAQIALNDPMVVAFLRNHLKDKHGIVLNQGDSLVFKFDISAQLVRVGTGPGPGPGVLDAKNPVPGSPE